MLRDYLKNDFDIYACPDGWYTKATFMTKWGGAYYGDHWPFEVNWASPMSSNGGLVDYRTGYLLLPHRLIRGDVAGDPYGGNGTRVGQNCSPAGVAQTDKPGEVAKTASDLPELHLLADNNIFANRIWWGDCSFPPQGGTCGVAANHLGTSFKGMQGYANACVPYVSVPNIGREENPLEMPLGMNRSRIDARTKWLPWQDWDYYKYNVFHVPGSDDNWHAF